MKRIIISFVLVASLFICLAMPASAMEQVAKEEETTENSQAAARSFSEATYHCDGSSSSGVVGYVSMPAYPLWRNDMPITVTGFSSETDIRVIIKNNNGKVIFDTFDSSVGCLNTSGYYSIDVNLPPASRYDITCDIYGSVVSSGDVHFVIK